MSNIDVFSVTPKDVLLLTDNQLEQALVNARHILPSSLVDEINKRTFDSDNPHVLMSAPGDKARVLASVTNHVQELYDEIFSLTKAYTRPSSPQLYSSLLYKHAAFSGMFTTSAVNGVTMTEDNIAPLMDAIIGKLECLLPGLGVCRVGQVLLIVNHHGVLAYHHPVLDKNDRLEFRKRILHRIITTEKSFDVVYKHILAELN